MEAAEILITHSPTRAHEENRKMSEEKRTVSGPLRKWAEQRGVVEEWCRERTIRESAASERSDVLWRDFYDYSAGTGIGAYVFDYHPKRRGVEKGRNPEGDWEYRGIMLKDSASSKPPIEKGATTDESQRIL